MTVCIIPARGGSRRIPRKNIKPFLGVPIIGRSITTAKESGLFDAIYVSTEDAEIAEVARQFGAQIIYRPVGLAADEVGTQTVMQHAVGLLDDRGTLCCCLYPTAPLLTRQDLIEGHNMLVNRPCNYVVAVAADPLRDIGNMYWGLGPAFSANTSLWGRYTGLHVMPPERAIDINTEDDWIRAEQMYRALETK